MMANDKDFIIKNALEVGKDTKVTLGTVTSNNVDLSTGNYFADTPSGTSTYTFSNPGDVQAFQLELTGGTAEVASVFSTTLYTGNGSTQTITNGIDLAGEGGLVWVKTRAVSDNHSLIDTERGGTYELNSNTTSGQGGGLAFTFNSDGFSIGNSIRNANTAPYASWTFRKAAGFFDVVTYTGDGVAGRTVSHNLGTTVGTLIVKKTSGTDNWFVWHRNLTDATYRLLLNFTTAQTQQTNAWNSTAPTSTEFTLGDNANVNENGATYVAYLFAHDTAADGLIQCGSYTGAGSGSSTEVDLGWEPQWVMIKDTTDSIDSNWMIFDNMRGIATGGNDAYLKANSSSEEFAYDFIDLTSTGFKTSTNGYGDTNTSGNTYIYIAIRAASDPDITWPASVEWTAGVAPSAPATGETDVYTFVTDDGGTSYIGLQTADNLS